MRASKRCRIEWRSQSKKVDLSARIHSLPQTVPWRIGRPDRFSTPEYKICNRRFGAHRANQCRNLPSVIPRVTEQLCEYVFNAAAKTRAVVSLVLEDARKSGIIQLAEIL